MTLNDSFYKEFYERVT